ncbi:MAG: glutamine-hydrolyzing carbamoyl-phosphate synthase small subunit [SAR202 cluster bacterium]|nr:glutamine-hydrolyzing carbamoyl-phosphate synthase small subunit [SAR202 cluster bacterium]
MIKPAYLVLQDGSFYEGESFGSNDTAIGELVFNTSMTGYQEMLTDPSYSGQIVMPTYPIIGNYGINENDMESNSIKVSGFVVREHCLDPSHSTSIMNLSDYLISNGIPGISGIDTRSLVRKIRSSGVMMGMIAIDIAPEEALSSIKNHPQYDTRNFVEEVSTIEKYSWGEDDNAPLILVSDYGLKYNILRILRSKGFRVMALPSNTTYEEISAMRPQGIILSPGPGDPALLDTQIDIAKHLLGEIPMMGICLGHQIIARAFGAETFKLKFGHRGGNHPVKDEHSSRVYITSQNHGYAVDFNNLPTDLVVSHTNLNDGTIEGLEHKDLPIMSIQYHSEASPGPLDNIYLFDKFLRKVENYWNDR